MTRNCKDNNVYSDALSGTVELPHARFAFSNHAHTQTLRANQHCDKQTMQLSFQSSCQDKSCV